MRVLHVIPSLSSTEGGPSFAVKEMADVLARCRLDVTILTTREAKSEEQRGKGEEARGQRSEDIDQPSLPGSEDTSTERGGYGVISFPRNFEPYKVSFGLAKWLRGNVKKFDLVHIHALFSFSSTVAARMARRNGVPYIVRPLGVLNRWGMRNRRRATKAISFRLVELPILLNAAAIHYTSEAERKQAAELDSKLAEHESAVIPLPVEQRSWSKEQRAKSEEQFFEAFPEVKGKRIILFLSRIHPMKGLEILLDAFAVVREKNKDVALVVAGEGDRDYVTELRAKSEERRAKSAKKAEGRGEKGERQGAKGEEVRVKSEGEGRKEKGEASDLLFSISDLQSQDFVIWTGHLSGEVKAGALGAADVFVLPSASENFGIAAAEALAAGVPTIVSEEVALSDDIRRYDAGLVVKRDVRELAGAINDLLSNREKAATLAANGRRLAEERYSPEAVGKALHQLYSKILKR